MPSPSPPPGQPSRVPTSYGSSMRQSVSRARQATHRLSSSQVTFEIPDPSHGFLHILLHYTILSWVIPLWVLTNYKQISYFVVWCLLMNLWQRLIKSQVVAHGDLYGKFFSPEYLESLPGIQYLVISFLVSFLLIFLVCISIQKVNTSDTTGQLPTR